MALLGTDRVKYGYLSGIHNFFTRLTFGISYTALSFSQIFENSQRKTGVKSV